MKIKFITINIWNGGKLFDNIVAFIKKENPDIIALQEVYSGTDQNLPRHLRTIESLQNVLQYPNLAFSPAVLDQRKDFSIPLGNLVLSKYPIIENKTIYFDIPYGEFDFLTRKDFENSSACMQQGMIAVAGKTLQVNNIHGIWGEHGDDTKRRLHMADIIVENINFNNSCILAGDFNVQPYTKTIAHIEEKLKNIFKNELTSTFNMKHKDKIGYATAVVDMVFISNQIPVLSHYLPAVDVSDHYPLVVEIDL